MSRRHQIDRVDFGSINLPALKDLYISARWDWSNESMSLAFQNSFGLYLCTTGGRMVGFARIISDQAIYGLLVDFMVHPDFRRLGIGSELVQYALSDAQERGLKVIQLLASSEGYPIYSKFGFAACPNHSPGMVKFLHGDAKPV